MSYTGYYSRLYPIRHNKIREKEYVRILRLDDLENYLQKNSFGDILSDTFFGEEKETIQYPNVVYKTLIGFKTWKVNRKNDALYLDKSDDLRLGQIFNIDRFGIGYCNESDILCFFGSISEFTEPFVIFHSNEDNRLAKIWEFIIDEDIENVIYKIEAKDGHADLTTINIEFKEVRSADSSHD